MPLARPGYVRTLEAARPARPSWSAAAGSGGRSEGGGGEVRGGALAKQRRGKEEEGALYGVGRSGGRGAGRQPPIARR